MSALVVHPTPWAGELEAPPSKSIAHRALLAAALAQGRSRITGVELSQDMLATLGAMRALGAEVDVTPHAGGLVDVAVLGLTPGPAADMSDIDCGESGSTLRFVIPVALAARGGGVFRGSLRLMQRSLAPYYDAFAEKGILTERAESSSEGALTVRGTLHAGAYRLAGNVSSQFFTGLLLALPLLADDSSVESIGPLESQPYVDITRRVLSEFGIQVQTTGCDTAFHIAGGQHYRPREFAVEGDWSQAACPLVGGLLGRGVSVGGLNPDSAQGDRVIERLLMSMGAALRWQGGRLVAVPSALHGADIDVSDCPDLAPMLAAAMAVAQGVGRIHGGARLRDKESDRITAIAAVINALGGDAAPTADGLIIVGRQRLRGGTCDASNDHRIAMMAAALSARCEQDVVLGGHGSVRKSWPGFWAAVRQLGGVWDEQ